MKCLHNWLICSLLVMVGQGVAFAETTDIESEIVKLQSAHLYGEAIAKLKGIAPTSEDGPLAARLLGEASANGLGVEVNLELAVQYYRIAAKANEPKAQYLLGKAYEHGLGIPASAASAFTWYDTSALTSPRGALRYAEIVLANQDRTSFVVRHEPIERLEYAAERGLAQAKYILGTLLVRGEIVLKDVDRAVSLLEDAAETMPKAMTALATLKHQGNKFDQAKRLFKSAFLKGDVIAPAFLGHYAEHGITEPINRKKALDLYTKSEGVDWADEGQRRLKEHFTSIEMFGIKMYGMTRDQLKEKLKVAGIRRVGGEPHFDAFDVTRQIGRRGVMTIAYAPGKPGFIAEIGYRFDADNNRTLRALYDELVVSLSEQYGELVAEKRKRGNKKVRWNKESTSIQLDYLSGKKYLTITYRLNPYSTELTKYVARLRTTEKGILEDAL